MSVNKCILVGNLGADPESRQTNSGTTVCNLRLATTSRVKSGDDWEDKTEWHRVVCFGKTAESAGQYLSKGRQIYVEGRIQTNKWQDKDGNDKYTTEIVADQVRFLGKKEDGGQQSGGGQGGRGQGGGGYGGSGGGSGYGGGRR